MDTHCSAVLRLCQSNKGFIQGKHYEESLQWLRRWGEFTLQFWLSTLHFTRLGDETLSAWRTLHHSTAFHNIPRDGWCEVIWIKTTRTPPQRQLKLPLSRGAALPAGVEDLEKARGDQERE
jgi:hypothetical protein